MPTRPADPAPPASHRPHHPAPWGAARACTLLLASALLVACGSSEPDAAPPASSGGPSVSTAPSNPDDAASAAGQGGLAVGRARAVLPMIDRVLADRSAALLAGDRTAFARTLDLADEAFTTTQGTYFDNLVQLPLAELEIRALPSSLVRQAGDYWAVVEVSTRLEGFDEAPVLTRDRYRFSAGPGGRLLVSSVSDPAWEAAEQPWSQPWDDGTQPLQVVAADGVLGIFDAQSVADADRLVADTRRALADVDGVVPYPWPGTVVLYALSTTDFLRSIDPPLGGVPERLDGLAFTRGEGTTARVVLHPRMLGAAGPSRDRLLRHEITHVAVGPHDDAAPVWLSEGLAEWVSVRPLPVEERRIPRAAVAAAVARTLRDLPADDTFAEDEELGYAVSWWACEVLASTLGEPGLWALLDELDAAGAALPDDAPPAERSAAVDARLESLTGFSRRALARQAAKLIRSTYAPQDAAPDPPGASPGEQQGDLPDTPSAGDEPAPSAAAATH